MSDDARQPVMPDSSLRSSVIRVPITVTLEALAQDNGDGTWTVAVPALTRGTETAPTLDCALRRMSDVLSVVEQA